MQCIQTNLDLKTENHHLKESNTASMDQQKESKIRIKSMTQEIKTLKSEAEQVIITYQYNLP